MRCIGKKVARDIRTRFIVIIHVLLLCRHLCGISESETCTAMTLIYLFGDGNVGDGYVGQRRWPNAI